MQVHAPVSGGNSVSGRRRPHTSADAPCQRSAPVSLLEAPGPGRTLGKNAGEKEPTRDLEWGLLSVPRVKRKRNNSACRVWTQNGARTFSFF